MPESRNIEWKESWRDEYLKWICCFANAQGGRILLGEDDTGLSISNSCILPLGWTEESLTRRHRSRPFNPCLVNAFFRAGFIESWGLGIARLYQHCSQYGAPPPQYELQGEDITIVFSPAVNNSISEPVKDTPPRPEPVVELSAAEMRFVAEVRQNSKINQTDLAEKLQISRRSIQRIKSRLIVKNVLLNSRKQEWILLCNPENLAECVQGRKKVRQICERCAKILNENTGK